jgi:spore coat polysaccharide biosynthesis predicted glycosyltransferase SpsG
MGGVDKDNATGRVLEALSASELICELAVTVVMGSSAPWLAQVREQAATLAGTVEVAVDVADMADRMVKSDFAIGAAGSTSWERCCMGLPSALVVIAHNQEEACLALVASGAAFDLGSTGNIVSKLPVLLGKIREEPSILANMSRCAARISDGMGVSRVGEALLGP